MANCPKCGVHLRLIDWKQRCPQCGANLVLYDLQERLMQDADIAEVQHYHFQKKIDRLKAAFIGSKAAVVRIFTSLLPIGALFLPLWRLTAPAAAQSFLSSGPRMTGEPLVYRYTGSSFFPASFSFSISRADRAGLLSCWSARTFSLFSLRRSPARLS